MVAAAGTNSVGRGVWVDTTQRTAPVEPTAVELCSVEALSASELAAAWTSPAEDGGDALRAFLLRGSDGAAEEVHRASGTEGRRHSRTHGITCATFFSTLRGVPPAGCVRPGRGREVHVFDVENFNVSIGNLTGNTEYCVRAAAANSVGAGPDGEAVCARTGPVAPAAPALDEPLVGPDFLHLAWSPGDDGGAPVRSRTGATEWCFQAS